MSMAKRTQTTKPEAQPRRPKNIAVDLGIPQLVDFESLGYTPTFANVKLTKKGREAAKRLAVTLDQSGARLEDGTLVKNSIPQSIAWLCERLADAT